MKTEMFNELLDAYIKLYGRRGRKKLEEDIRKIMEDRSLSKDKALGVLYQEVRGILRGLVLVNSERVKVKYEGKHYGVLYWPIEDFETDLRELGAVLDYVEERMGKVIAIIPNIGLTKTSLILGTSFQGVKGFAIIYERQTCLET